MPLIIRWSVQSSDVVQPLLTRTMTLHSHAISLSVALIIALVTSIMLTFAS